MHLRTSARSGTGKSARGRRLRLAAACTAGVLLAAMPPGAAPAAPERGVALPLPGASDVVATDSRVFVSGGQAATEVVVTDAAGALITTLDGLPGPTDLALSEDRRTLYVALTNGGAIAAFDTTSLREVARYPVGSCPATVAPAGRYLWFGYACESDWYSYVGSVDLQQPTIIRKELARLSSDSPLLATGEDPGTLVLGDAKSSPASVHVYRVAADGTLTRQRSSDHTAIGSSLRDLAVSPDSSTVFTACGSPYLIQRFWMDDLTEPMHRYPTGAYPNAVELAPDGDRVAGGVSATYDPDVYVFDLDSVVVGKYELGEELVDGGLAWSPDGSRLYAVSHDSYPQPPVRPHLHVLTPGS